MLRRQACVFLATSAIGAVGAFHALPTQAQLKDCEDHCAWLARVWERMQTVKTGMTRKTLLTVFSTEGGLSTGLRRTYVSQDCPYLKVDVDFKAVGRADRDQEGRVTLVEADDDVIVGISAPYMQLSVMD
jgi:hypothetical protein